VHATTTTAGSVGRRGPQGQAGGTRQEQRVRKVWAETVPVEPVERARADRMPLDAHVEPGRCRITRRC